LPPLAIFFALVPRPKTWSCATRLLPEPRSHDLLHFDAIFGHLFVNSPPSSRLVSPGCRAYPAGSGKARIRRNIASFRLFFGFRRAQEPVLGPLRIRRERPSPRLRLFSECGKWPDGAILRP
jgi:hypothetical protein